VIAATLFGLIGVALGYITRSTIAAVVGAIGWVLFVELAILHTIAPTGQVADSRRRQRPDRPHRPRQRHP